MGKINNDGSYTPGEGRSVLVDRACDRISNEVYYLYKGVRTCALIPLDGNEKLEEILELRDYLEWLCTTGEVQLKFGVFQERDEIFIYTYEHELKIYELVSKMYAVGLANEIHYMREFILGKLLGYSSESMERYLKKFE